MYVYARLQRIEPEGAARIAAEFSIDVDALPRGAIVGTVEIIGCEPLSPERSQSARFRVTRTTGGYAWFLKNPRRARTKRKPTGHPQPSFFTPF